MRWPYGGRMLDNVRCMQHATCSQGSAQSDFFQVRRDQSTSKRSQCSQQDEIEKQNILSKDFVPAALSRTSTPSWYLRTLSICYCLFLRFSFGVLFRIPSNFEQRGQLHPPPTLAHFHHSNTPPPISRHPSSSLYDRSAVLPRTPLQSHVGLRIFN